jgi:hypothetical protein
MIEASHTYGFCPFFSSLFLDGPTEKGPTYYGGQASNFSYFADRIPIQSGQWAKCEFDFTSRKQSQLINGRSENFERCWRSSH